MPRKRKLHIVDGDPRVAREPITDVSPQEEARFLQLADVALNNPPPKQNLTELKLGDLAKQDHQRLTHDVREMVAKFR